jgi:hypothetical protein
MAAAGAPALAYAGVMVVARHQAQHAVRAVRTEAGAGRYGIVRCICIAISPA